MGDNNLNGTVPNILEEGAAAVSIGNIFEGNENDTPNTILETNKTNFQRLVLSKNEDLTGPLPDLSGLFSSLVELGLGSTHMSGTFPIANIANHTRLEVLDLAALRNPQSDLLQSLTALTNLKMLNLENSRLHEKIPESIGNLVSLGKQR